MIKWTLRHIGTVCAVVFVTLFLYALRDPKKPFDRPDQLKVLLAALGGVALLLTVYDRRQNLKRQLRNDENAQAIREVQLQDQNFQQLLQQLYSTYPESYYIFTEMFGTDGMTKPTQIDPARQQIVETMISLRVFQITENFLTIASVSVIPVTLAEWMTRLLQWFRSPTIQANYNRHRGNFASDAQDFMDQLVTVANEMNALPQPVSPQAYATYVSKITFTPRQLVKE